ncbi:MAG TPA: hypothetical protein ENI69_05360, partial [Rhodospirillales bacterium]|nr:hypothetical protein [Rhodospirillales bacterium]
MTIKFNEKKVRRGALSFGVLAAVSLATVQMAEAHEPIFTPGAHVHSKGGHELALEYHQGRKSGAGEKELERELALKYEYGVTADWTVKAAIPLID